jgi:hypothetical protein
MNKKQIMDEAERHIREVNAGFTAQLPPVEDSLQRYKRDSEERAAREAAARQERRAEEQRERGAAQAIAELRAELAELRGVIAAGDAKVLDVVASSLMPLFDRVGDRLDEVSSQVTAKLEQLEANIRASEARATRFIDASPPPQRREVN